MFCLNMIGQKVIIFVIDTGDTCISSNQYRIVFEIHGIAHHYIEYYYWIISIMSCMPHAPTVKIN